MPGWMDGRAAASFLRGLAEPGFDFLVNGICRKTGTRSLDANNSLCDRCATRIGRRRSLRSHSSLAGMPRATSFTRERSPCAVSCAREPEVGLPQERLRRPAAPALRRSSSVAAARLAAPETPRRPRVAADGSSAPARLNERAGTRSQGRPRELAESAACLPSAAEDRPKRCAMPAPGLAEAW